MKRTWRLLIDEPQDGYTNMAVDEALLHALAADAAPPTVRFFRWRPACVSVGYFQSARDEVDIDACHRLGVDYVRRPTGGRAILHDSEITYSVVARIDDPMVSGNILESYRKISAALILGLSGLGIAAEMKPLDPESIATPPFQTGRFDPTLAAHRAATAACFDLPSDYEIAVGGRKLVGSAQTRQGEVLLQHGSILIDVDPLRVFTVLRPPPNADRKVVAQWLGGRITSLQQLLHRAVSFEEVAEAVSEGLRGAFGVMLEPGALSVREQQLAERLRAEKYATAEWNLKK